MTTGIVIYDSPHTHKYCKMDEGKTMGDLDECHSAPHSIPAMGAELEHTTNDQDINHSKNVYEGPVPALEKDVPMDKEKPMSDPDECHPVPHSIAAMGVEVEHTSNNQDIIHGQNVCEGPVSKLKEDITEAVNVNIKQVSRIGENTCIEENNCNIQNNHECSLQLDNNIQTSVENHRNESMAMIEDSQRTVLKYNNEAIKSNGVTENSEEEENKKNIFPQSHLNFDSPLMVLDYQGVFNTSKNNYTKGCKWSPDGSCLLVTSNDKMVRIFNLPTPLVDSNFPTENWFCSEAKLYGHAAVTVREQELVLDYAWYPAMRSDNPRSCCFVVTSRDHPVHLWDAWNGQLICGYYSYDHLDQMVAAHSTAFNLDGSLIMCGFKKCIRVFHTNRPGRYFNKIDAKDQPGIISCMAFNPQLPSVLVAGSYLGSLGLYNTNRNNLFMRIDGNQGGVTHVQFSADGTKLFSGMRKNNEILCWDIRNPGTLLCGFKREVLTNQRIYFDLDPQYNRHLVTGDSRGLVSQWDLSACETQGTGVDSPSLQPASMFSAHKDCTNGISLHPYYPILATSSGQRHFPEPVSDADSDSDTNSNPGGVSRPLFTQTSSAQENTVKLWWLGR